ncbi:hypothetical protein IFR05_001951 [Cadophora sp. M221]|nr:hypothetical protein IFR05_001951 [Cadophora sp. M221]
MAFKKRLSRFNRVECDISGTLQTNLKVVRHLFMWEAVRLGQVEQMPESFDLLAGLLGANRIRRASASETTILKAIFIRLRLQSAVLETFLHLEAMGLVSHIGFRERVDMFPVTNPRSERKIKEGHVATRPEIEAYDNIHTVSTAIANFMAFKETWKALLEEEKTITTLYYPRWGDVLYSEPIQWLATIIIRSATTTNLGQIVSRIQECGQLGRPKSPPEFEEGAFEINPYAGSTDLERNPIAGINQPPGFFFWLPNGVSCLPDESSGAMLDRIKKDFDDKLIFFEKVFSKVFEPPLTSLLSDEMLLPAGYVQDEDVDSLDSGAKTENRPPERFSADGMMW